MRHALREITVATTNAHGCMGLGSGFIMVMILFMMTSFSVKISRIMKTGIIMNITVTGFTR
jgi:uncharacterized membrane protein YfcA